MTAEHTNDHQRFIVGDQPRLLVSGGAADVTVTVGEPGVVEVLFPSGGADRYQIQQRGDRITIRPRDRKWHRWELTVELVVPAGTDLKLSAASGATEVLGAVGDVDVSVASGDVHIDGAVGAVRVKSASGDVEVGHTSGVVDITSVSGDIRLGESSGAVSVATASGDVRLARIEDICSVNSVSGDVAIRECDATDLAVRTMSGDAVVGLPPRRTIELDFESIAGEVRKDQLWESPESGGEDAPPERTISVRCRSVSGDLTLRLCE